MGNMRYPNLFLSIVVFAFIVSVLFSCNDSSMEVPVPPREVSMTFRGLFPNWSSGSGFSLIAAAEVKSSNSIRKEGIDTASINSNGEFEMTLHNIYEKYSTEPISVSEPDCNTNIDPSPYTMRQAKINFEIYLGGEYKGQVTNIVHRVGADTINTYYVTYRAYSTAGRISGFKVCVNNDTTYTTYSDYNINTNLGWTKVVSKIVLKDTNYVAYSESNDDPEYGVVWEYSMK